VFSQQSTESCGESRGHQQYLHSAFAVRIPESREILLGLRIEPATLRPRPDHHHHCATCLKSNTGQQQAPQRRLHCHALLRPFLATRSCGPGAHPLLPAVLPQLLISSSLLTTLASAGTHHSAGCCSCHLCCISLQACAATLLLLLQGRRLSLGCLSASVGSRSSAGTRRATSCPAAACAAAQGLKVE
jgi:hypothetical protein